MSSENAEDGGTRKTEYQQPPEPPTVRHAATPRGGGVPPANGDTIVIDFTSHGGGSESTRNRETDDVICAPGSPSHPGAASYASKIFGTSTDLDAVDNEALLQEFSTKMNRSITLPPSERAKGRNAFAELPATTSQEMARMDNYLVSISDPYTSSHLPPFSPHNANGGYDTHDALLKAYHIDRHLYVQAFAAVAYFVVVILAMTQMFGGKGASTWFTFLCSLFYLAEVIFLFVYQGRCRLYYQTYWRAAEPAVLAVLVLFEFISVILYGVRGRSAGYTALSVFRFLLWLVHGKTRMEQFRYALRSFCSEGRRRYESEGVDLDYAYIHRNVVAMGWPATNFERWFRNSMEETAAFLRNKHPASCLVVNLCSERTYNPAYFGNQTAWYPMDDHNPAELEMMVAFCREASDFVNGDPFSRVIVLHCKGGKGRTGTLICAYLMFSGLKRTAPDALQHFASLRTKPGQTKFQGVQTASQARYVHYFDLLLRESASLYIPSVPMRISSFKLHAIPPLWFASANDDDMPAKLWFAIVTRPCTDRRVAFVSNPRITFDAKLPDPSTYTSKQLRDLLGDESSFYKSTQHISKKIKGYRGNDGNEAGAGGGDSSAAATAAPPELFPLDTDSFWFTVTRSHSQEHTDKMDYATFKQYLQEHPPPPQRGSKKAVASTSVIGSEDYRVSLEFRHPERIPTLDGDVAVKLYVAVNDANPLEAPVQFWFHTGMEAVKDSRDRRPNPRITLHLARNELDGPPKDKKFKRYPDDFAATVVLERQ